MSRSRSSVNGGYARKTISIPNHLLERLEKHLGKNEGLTLSALMTEAAQDFLQSQLLYSRRARKKRKS